ncbi:MAG TPA: hypothetical protein PKD24_10945 [Pyrinomonadaceae bacterium]|nr:hypothetical protein [Pyrinomonadaceae bacterium]HMP65443.1 hypothetical protein [Pyrinomonadaceae bacterium]
MQNILGLNLQTAASAERPEASFGRKIGLVGKLFGCWHKRLSRPFTYKREVSYRACLECGARRRFNTESFTTSGPFYYPPMARPDNARGSA